jgi:predicted DNA-binding transcriptional regulator AlpA
MAEQVINDVAAARFLGLGVQTLRNYRSHRKGPKYIKIGGRIVYRVADLEKFLDEHTINPEAN